MLFFTVSWQAPWRHANYVVLQPADTDAMMVYVPEGGARGKRSRSAVDSTSRTPPQAIHSRGAQSPPASVTRPAGSAAVSTTVAAAIAAAVAPSPPAAPSPPRAAPSPPESSLTMPAYDPNATRVAPAPQVGDGRLWVSPRPALPATVAAALYGDTTERHSAAIERLRAMVDSLNQVLDLLQREKQRPRWTVGGTPEKPEWGIDSAYIHVAGVKIPTPVLALLGNLLPQGNFDEDMRIRELNYMRQDILQAADRAQSLQEFKRYVHELRERRQAERDADQHRKQDTVKAVP
ncbi:MAG TPA: hypothetical protein VG454_15870 [Gemmatimonadales bacterium]|nr:hypothetical protein [Gemmatimonadales bacterium]